MKEPHVYLHHVPRPGWCAKGMRPWFAANGLDWNDFRKNGCPGEALLAIGDHYALTVLDIARQEQEKNGRI